MAAPERDLLRFLTCGSVDDGKSTLIGRLLHDSRAVYEDQIENVRKNSRDSLELAFITDGLRAEREQGITIDVAYRYFATRRRRFIIADTPGHEQYTRNMATGASTADLAVILVDARRGVLPQTRRHAYIAHLLGIRRILVAVNKMDSVGYAQQVFESIRQAFLDFAERMPGAQAEFMPVSALLGDNVVSPSGKMPWHTGPPLLEYLETVPAGFDRDGPFRMPVQYVIRSRDGVRCYGGQIASGAVRPGDELIALPSGRSVRVSSLPAKGGDLADAAAPRSVALALDDHVDLGRGDMLADPAAPPVAARRFSARLVWMSERPLAVGRPYLLKQATQLVCAEVTRLESALDIHTLEERPAQQLALNEIGTAEIETHRPLFFDPYDANRALGSFVLIDPMRNGTEAAGMIRTALANGARSEGQHAAPAQTGLALWFTGLSSAGKSTLARALYERLWAAGLKVEILDGDAVRENLSKGLGFSREDRDENIRRIAFVAQLLVRNGVIVLVSAISPYRAVRAEARERIGSFAEIYVNAPLETCEKRDLKGIYRKGRAGLIRGVTGLDDPYEPPLHPEVECRTDRETLAESLDKVASWLHAQYGLGDASIR